MNVEGCWSTVICNASERAAVGYQGKDWALQCRLSSGHDGHHATDGDRGAAPVRRRWLEWTDFSEYPHSLLERDPCDVVGRGGEPCQFYLGHGGLHFYAPAAPRPREEPAPPQDTAGAQLNGHRPSGPHTTGTHALGAHASRAMPPRPRRTAEPGTRVHPTSHGTDYRGGHRLADEPSTESSPPGQSTPARSPEVGEPRRSDAIDRIDDAIRESMELLETEQRSVAAPSGADVSAADAAAISDALFGVAEAFERLAQAYRLIGR